MLRAGNYVGQVGRIMSPLSGVSAAHIHASSKARALGDAGVSLAGVSGLSGVGLGLTPEEIACAGAGAAAGAFLGSGTKAASGWAGALTAGATTFLGATLCRPSAPPAPPVVPAAPPPGTTTAPSVVYVPTAPAPSPFPMQQRSGMDQTTLLTIAGIGAAVVLAIVLLK